MLAEDCHNKISSLVYLKQRPIASAQAVDSSNREAFAIISPVISLIIVW